MKDLNPISDQDIYRFIFERIDSVPHLEALSLIWNTRPNHWSVDDLAHRLYVDRNIATELLQDLTRQGLLVDDPSSSERYFYEAKSGESDRMIAAVCAKYRVEIVAVSTMIHRKASSAVLNFADAFRFKKERE